MKLHRHFMANSETLTPFDFKRELVMQAYIIENPEVLGLDADQFPAGDVQIIDEELHLVGGGKGNDSDGRIDVLAFANNFVGVVELKNGELQERHLDQLRGYLKEKDQILRDHCKEMLKNSDANFKFIGILVGSSIDMNLAQRLCKGDEFEGVQIAAIELQRYKSETTGNLYVTSNVYFKPKKRDYSKFKFRGGNGLPKNRFVLAVVQDFVGSHKELGFSDLKKEFPNELQGTAVFVTKKEAEQIRDSSSSQIKRHFLNPEELMTLRDGTVIAVSNQWGVGSNPNFPEFLKKAKQLYPNDIIENV